jgi:hypothetical protein
MALAIAMSVWSKACEIRSKECKVLFISGTYRYMRMYWGYIAILSSHEVRNSVYNLLTWLHVGVEVCAWVREKMTTGIVGWLSAPHSVCTAHLSSINSSCLSPFLWNRKLSTSLSSIVIIIIIDVNKNKVNVALHAVIN